MTAHLTLTHGLGSDVSLDAIAALRRAAWTPIVGAEAADDRFGLDDEDHRAWHVTVHDRDALVAAGRLAVRLEPVDLPEAVSFTPWVDGMVMPAGFASRLVVRPDRQGAGLGERIIRARLALACDLGLHQVWGETRTHHIDGLARHGYRLVGPSTDESVPGEWHIMCAPLSGAGATPRSTRRRP